MKSEAYKITNGATMVFIPGFKAPMMPGEFRVISRKEYHNAQRAIKVLSLKVEVVQEVESDNS